MLIDIHCHLDHSKFDHDRDEVIQRAEKADVKLILTNGINHETNQLSLELSKKYKIVKPALGIYPSEAIKLTNDQIDQEIKFIKKNKSNLLAIGEVGLDLKWDKDEKHFEKQIEVFEKLIKLAISIKKPLIIHSRDAEQQTLDILKKHKPKKVLLHCFGGNQALVEQAENEGYYFSIPTNITLSKHFRKIVKKVNINKLLTETDAPYLGPERGVRNESKNIIVTINKIAELKGMEESEVINNIYMNYQRLFEE